MGKMLLSKYVAERRKQLGLTQKDVAALLYYTPQAMSRFESVDSAFPLTQVDALCQALDCSLNDIHHREIVNAHYAPLPFAIEDAGALFAKARKEKGVGQEEIAKKCGVTVRSVRNYEKGDSQISLQFLDAFCDALGILPSELSVSSEPVMPVAPPPKRRFGLILGSSLAAAAIAGIAVATVFLLKPSVPPIDAQPGVSLIMGNSVESQPDDPQTSSVSPHNSDASSSSESEGSSNQPASSLPEISSSAPVSSSSDDGLGKYGLEIVEGLPSFLTLEYDRDAFGFIGDTIEVQLKDKFNETQVSLTSADDITIECYGSGGAFALSHSLVSSDTIALTLTAGYPGEGAYLVLTLWGDWGGMSYYELGFFRYQTADLVYLESDTDHKYPFNGGKALASNKSEINLNINDINFVAYNQAIFKDGVHVLFEEGIEPSFMHGLSMMEATHYDHLAIPATIGDNRVTFPKETLYDDFLITVWVSVQGGESGTYWYALEPLHVHIVR